MCDGNDSGWCTIQLTFCNASPLIFQLLSQSSLMRSDLICPLMSTLGMRSASDIAGAAPPPPHPSHLQPDEQTDRQTDRH